MSEAGSGNVYEAALAGLAAAAGTGAGSEKSGQPPLRPSAAVVPWRRTAAGGIEVYWVKRGESLAFMGGWHAFPGGGLARGDAEIEVTPTAIAELAAEAAVFKGPADPANSAALAWS